MLRATSRTCCRSAEPSSPGGVPTAMRMTSERSMAAPTSVVNSSRPSRWLRITSGSSPGSWIGSRFCRNPSIFAASTSTQRTSFPVSAKQAPATRPTYPVPTTVIFTSCPPPPPSPPAPPPPLAPPGPRQGVPGVDDQRRAPLHERIVHVGVVGHDDHAVGARDLLRRERDRREVDGLIPKPRDVRIVIRDHRAPPLQQADHVESGALADVVDVLLVRHADDQHLAAPRGAPLLVEAIHDAPHPVLGHLGVDLARELDESRPVVERPHFPREVVRVEGD